MWYLGSLFVLITFLLGCTYVGSAVCRLLPWRIRPHGTLAFAPIVGLAVFVLVATSIGWLGTGFHTWICLPVSIGLVVLSLLVNHDSRTMATAAVRVACFSAIASLGWLFSIIRFGAFNVYNDAFIYLVHSQWLQDNAFRTKVTASGQYPAISEVAMFQLHGLRMGASFLFGWVQATFGIEWSYLVYPPVVLLPVVACAIALAGMAFFVIRKGRTICMLGGMVIGTTLNGCSFGSLYGFLHQTYGIAFGFASLGILGMCLGELARGTRLEVSKVIPCVLPFVAMFYCYPEIAPFIAMAALVCLGALCLRRSSSGAVLDFSWKLVTLVLVLLNVEILRIFRALFLEGDALVGTPIPWNPMQYFGHAAGFAAGAWDGSEWTFGSAVGSELAAVLFVAAACFALIVCHHRIRVIALMPALSMAGVVLFAFLYYRYMHSSPWSLGTGQSWSQFKLSNWVSIFLLLVMICGLAAASYGPRWARLAAIGWLAIWQTSGLVWHYRLSDGRTASLRQETGFSDSPFDSFIQIRQAARYAGEAPIFLDLGSPYSKNRQIVSYILYDHALASDWSDDGYLIGALPPDQRTMKLQPSMWILAPVDLTQPIAKERRIGRLGLESVADKGVILSLSGVNGGYDEETDSSGSWRWAAHSLEYRYRVSGDKPVRLRARFTYLPAGGPRKLRISLVDGNASTLQILDMQLAWTPFATLPFTAGPSEFSIKFDSDEQPVHLGASDPRMLGFLIKNLSLEVVE